MEVLMYNIIDFIEAVERIEKIREEKQKQFRRFWNFVHRTVKHRKAVETKLKLIHGANYTHWRRDYTPKTNGIRKAG